MLSIGRKVPRAAIVTASYDDGSLNGKRREETNTYDIVKFEGKDVILVHNGLYGIDVLTFNGAIGSFTQTISNANTRPYGSRGDHSTLARCPSEVSRCVPAL
jgi:hypothetical protein